MKKSELNKGVLENFALWYTHKNRDEANNEEGLKDIFQLSAERLYQAIDEYISEDHVDGEDNQEDHIVTFGTESSYKTDDPNHLFDELTLVVADFGEEIGTQTVTSIEGIENKEPIEQLLEFIKDPYGQMN